jgi:hypothetical protein
MSTLTTIIVALRNTFALSVQACVDGITALVQSMVDTIAATVKALFDAVTAIIKPVCDDIRFVSHNGAGDQQYSSKDQAAFYCIHYVPCIHVSTP